MQCGLQYEYKLSYQLVHVITRILTLFLSRIRCCEIKISKMIHFFSHRIADNISKYTV